MNLESKKSCKAAEFSAKKNLEEDEDGEEMSGREWKKENAKIFSKLKLWRRWRFGEEEETRKRRESVEILSPLLSSNWFI